VPPGTHSALFSTRFVLVRRTATAEIASKQKMKSRIACFGSTVRSWTAPEDAPFCRLGQGMVSSILLLLYFVAAAPLIAQGTPQVPVIRPKPPVAQPSTPPAHASGDSPEASADDSPPPSDWAPALLDAILESSNASAAESLYDAAFAAGPDLIPQLQAALKDDRTAEFAAQCLAFMGTPKSMEILQTLVSDPRDLDLRRFYLGALGEYRDPAVKQLLLSAVAKSDQEPDRTVSEAAVWALTVRSDSDLPSQLRQAEAKILDVVIRDDVDNAAQVIEARAHYLASPEGRNAGSSIERAVRTYFIAELGRETESERSPGKTEAAPAKAEVRHMVFNPDGSRALAHVTFDDPEGNANYDMVLQKQLGDWSVVSVWVGAEIEKPQFEKPEPVAPVRKATPPAAKGPSSRTTVRPPQ
jgi:HEAT repeats